MTPSPPIIPNTPTPKDVTGHERGIFSFFKRAHRNNAQRHDHTYPVKVGTGENDLFADPETIIAMERSDEEGSDDDSARSSPPPSPFPVDPPSPLHADFQSPPFMTPEGPEQLPPAVPQAKQRAPNRTTLITQGSDYLQQAEELLRSDELEGRLQEALRLEFKWRLAELQQWTPHPGKLSKYRPKEFLHDAMMLVQDIQTAISIADSGMINVTQTLAAGMAKLHLRKSSMKTKGAKPKLITGSPSSSPATSPASDTNTHIANLLSAPGAAQAAAEFEEKYAESVRSSLKSFVVVSPRRGFANGTNYSNDIDVMPSIPEDHGTPTTLKRSKTTKKRTQNYTQDEFQNTVFHEDEGDYPRGFSDPLGDGPPLPIPPPVHRGDREREYDEYGRKKKRDRDRDRDRDKDKYRDKGRSYEKDRDPDRYRDKDRRRDRDRDYYDDERRDRERDRERRKKERDRDRGRDKGKEREVAEFVEVVEGQEGNGHETGREPEHREDKYKQYDYEGDRDREKDRDQRRKHRRRHYDYGESLDEYHEGGDQEGRRSKKERRKRREGREREREHREVDAEVTLPVPEGEEGNVPEEAVDGGPENHPERHKDRRESEDSRYRDEDRGKHKDRSRRDDDYYYSSSRRHRDKDRRDKDKYRDYDYARDDRDREHRHRRRKDYDYEGHDGYRSSRRHRRHRDEDGERVASEYHSPGRVATEQLASGQVVIPEEEQAKAMTHNPELGHLVGGGGHGIEQSPTVIDYTEIGSTYGHDGSAPATTRARSASNAASKHRRGQSSLGAVAAAAAAGGSGEAGDDSQGNYLNDYGTKFKEEFDRSTLVTTTGTDGA